MNELNIGLMGFETESPNKGCEALSYSFLGFLDREMSNCRVNIYVWDTPLGEIPSHFPNLNFVYIDPTLRDIKMQWARVVKKCDCVFDITMGDSFSDIYSKQKCAKRIFRKILVEKFAKQYVLLPQTYGPFSSKIIKKSALYVINRADIVMARDNKSIDYLKHEGATREIKKYIDMAFMLPYKKDIYKVDRSKVNLGINVSGLLWKGGFERENQFGMTIDYKLFILQIIQYFLSKKKYNVHLIPHVIDKRANAHDDDCFVIDDLKRQFPELIVSPDFANPILAKSYISNMDCFIGSRMHSTIAALSSGVPVVPVSYSRKFEGLFESLYYSYLINGLSFNTEEAICKAIEYVENREQIRFDIEKINKNIISETESLKSELREIINKMM